MTITFVSNYINHHQIPFSNAMYAQSGEDYCFIQTEPMEEERRNMGWSSGEEKENVSLAIKCPVLVLSKRHIV